VVYLSDQIVALCETGWGPIRGLWRILDGKVESGLMSDLELQSGSPPPPMSIKDRSLGPNEKV
jgi:hypothetical protein